MRTKFLAAALLASSMMAAPAFAQDANSTFTGPRAEAIVGWDRVQDDAVNGGGRDGVVYGGQIGYDFQAGSAVIGVEGEYTNASTKSETNNVLAVPDTLSVKAGRDLYLGARLGFTVGDRTMIYAKGGYTNAKFKTEYNSALTNISSSDNVDGWRLGAGAEVKLTDKVYAKAEYRYSHYDSDSAGINAKRHQVLGGVGVRF